MTQGPFEPRDKVVKVNAASWHEIYCMDFSLITHTMIKHDLRSIGLRLASEVYTVHTRYKIHYIVII